MFPRHVVFLLVMMASSVTIADSDVLHHRMAVRFDLDTGRFEVRDTVTRRTPAGEAAPLGGLSLGPAWRVDGLSFDGEVASSPERLADGRIAVPAGARSMTIDYQRDIDAGSRRHLVLGPATRWAVDGSGLRHRLHLRLSLPGAPAGVAVMVSAAATGEDGVFVQEHPQEGLHLVVGHWHRYRDGGEPARNVLLLDDDPALARRYLDAADPWLARYARAFGDYPYAGFTLVEHRRPVGWGMPGFTLMGSAVIRLPFIVQTSFPHEIAHNWWGNGVFVDPREGNWSEALTTYVADHLVREARGGGRRYRLDQLARWQDFAEGGRDVPLAEFRMREDEASQAVGYGKGMFVFHMLRRRLGDATFVEALRAVYREYRFRHLDFAGLIDVFERHCDCPLAGEFAQWRHRRGAPRLRLVQVRRGERAGMPDVALHLQQEGDRPWTLTVPVRVVGEDGTVSWHAVAMEDREARVSLTLPGVAARVDVDPELDLFRRLAEDERPATFGRVLGADAVTVVALDGRWRDAARTLAAGRTGWRAGSMADAGNTVVLLGGQPAQATRWLAPSPGQRRVEGGLWVVGEEPLPGDEVVALVDHGRGRDQVVLWLSSPGQAAATVARLAHYGGYSYAVFPEGERMASRRGQWQTSPRSLSRVFQPVTVPARDDAPLFW